MIAFVWVYWAGGSSSDGEELRYSLRSVATHCREPHQLVVVGDRPEWYRGWHIHVRRVRVGDNRSFRDSFHKLLVACRNDDLPPEIVWMMDDVYWLRPFGLEEIRKPYHGGYWSWGKIRAFKGSNKWQRIKRDTMGLLARDGLQTYDFATHAPHAIDRGRLLELNERRGLEGGRLLWEVVYGNEFYRYPVSIEGRLHRFLRPRGIEQLEREHRDTHLWLNNGAGAWNDHLRRWLARRMPKPSPVE